MSNFFVHDPDAKLDYTIDWSGFLGDSETISTSAWSVESGTATLSQESTSGAKTTVWVEGASGDTKGQVKLRNRITSSAGRIDDRTLTLLIAEQ